MDLEVQGLERCPRCERLVRIGLKHRCDYTGPGKKPLTRRGEKNRESSNLRANDDLYTVFRPRPYGVRLSHGTLLHNMGAE